MSLDYIYLLLLSILPLLYKFSFWMYVIQLKEYRIDRFKEYISSRQGKNALFSFWFFIEIPIFFCVFTIFFLENIEFIVYPIVFYFLLLQNIFVLGKVFRQNILKPKGTFKVILISLLISLDYIFGFYLSLLYFEKLIYILIFIGLLFPYIIIFLWNLIILPLVNYKKKELINKAIKKSSEINNIIKIGITGSYGKTSVKEFLSSVLGEVGETLKTPKNINTELGVSDLIIKKLNNKYEYFIAEMGAYKVGEIELLGEIVNHRYAFLTAIGNQHLGLFGSIENTKEAKFEIKNKVIENNGILYLNWDDENIRTLKISEELNIVKYGLENEDVDIKSEIISVKEMKTEFNIIYKKKQYTFITYLIGQHNILNITGIIAFCFDIGVKYSDLKEYILKLKNIDNTLTIEEVNYKGKKVKIIDDTYNLSENGLISGIKTLKSFSGEKILVVDDILELGQKSNDIHFELGKKIGNYGNLKIMYIGVNNKKDFLKGLKSSSFNNKNIINSFIDIKENTVLLFEGRNAKKYLNKIKNDI